MAIDAQNEEVLTLSEAARYCRPSGSRPLAPSTIWRWYRRGIAGIKLETICLGGTRCTSSQALRRFFVAVTEAKSLRCAPSERETTQSSERQIETRSRLEDAGLI